MASAQFSIAALPVLSRSVSREDGKSRFFIDVVLRGGFLLGGALSISGLAVGPVLVDWILGPAYHQVAELLPWTLFWVAPYVFMLSLNSVVVALGHYNWNAIAYFIGATVFTLAAFPLLHYFGILGIVWAIGAGLFAVNLAQLYILGRSFHIDYDRAVFRPLGVVLSSIFLCTRFAELNAWALLLLGLLALSLATLMVGVVRKKEIQYLRALLNKAA